MYSSTNPMYILANNVTFQSGVVIADGLAYELLVPFFLGAIHYGQESLVHYMAQKPCMKMLNAQMVEALYKEIDELANYEPVLIEWLRTYYGL
jgi:hypothetical protein